MKTGLSSVLAAALAAVVCIGIARSRATAAQPGGAGSGFKTVHLFNVKGPAEEQELKGVLAEFNGLFVKLGFPQCRYRLWKVPQPVAEKQLYLWESDWADRKTYDDIHKNVEFLKLVKERFVQLEALLKDHGYTQYQEIRLD
jgi:hypothetical protein